LPVYLKQFTKFANAGDAASNYLVGRLLGADIVLSDEAPLDRTNLIAVGSILQWADRHSIIWGSGLLSAEVRVREKPDTVLAVRGHLTRQRLRTMGIPCPETVGDPGILISDCVAPTRKVPGRIGIVPHYRDLAHPFVAAAQDQGAVLINPMVSLESYLAAVASCETIVSSSLHGIVFAHSFGIRAAWAKLSPNVLGDGFKFRDYYSSIGFADTEIPNLTGEDAFARIVDQASLPRSEIDRVALRGALSTVADRLGAE